MFCHSASACQDLLSNEAVIENEHGGNILKVGFMRGFFLDHNKKRYP